MSSALVVVMGVAGSGKTTVGRVLARRLDVPFADADSFHDPACVEKMRRGEPLTDAERAPWLTKLHGALAAAEGEGLVLACSALTGRAREMLSDGLPVQFVHLRGDPDLLRARLENRSGHFVGPSLLASQIDTLEPPDGAIEIDVADPPEVIVDRIISELGS
jgi:gluconokinase